MRKAFSFAILIISSLLYGEDEVLERDPFDTSLVSTQSLLPAIVQSVSPISGEWLNFSTDLVVAGPELLVLNRTYGPNFDKEGKLGNQWDFNREHPLNINTRDKKKFKASYKHSSGVTTIHKGYDNANHSRDKAKPITLYLDQRKGLTNCRLGEISGKTNLNNTVILLDPKKSHCTAHSGDGSLTYFKFKKKKKCCEKGTTYSYKPVFERKANGNLITFSGDKIEMFNSEETAKYSWIEIRSPSEQEVIAEASDGKTVRYQFNCKEKTSEHPTRFSLSEVSADHKPTERYEYVDKSLKRRPRLESKHWPDNRFQSVRYYEKGSNNVDGISPIYISSKRDFRYHRIRKILAPVGTDSNSIVTHQFVYHGRQEDKEVYDGTTDVYDAYLRKTTYEYNEDLRPTCIKRFDREGKRYSSEHYVWDDDRYYPSYLDPHLFMERIEWNLKRLRNYFPTIDQELEKKPSASRSQSPDAPQNEERAHEHAKEIAQEKKEVERAEEVPKKSHDEDHTHYISTTPNGEFVLPRKIPLSRRQAPLPKQIEELLGKSYGEMLPESISKEKLMKACLKAKILQKGNQGNLTGKYLQDANGNILHYQYFSYDDRGNVIQEILYGCLTGRNHTSMRLDGYLYPIEKNLECYCKRYTYSDDPYNLLLTEEEDNGKSIENVYWEDSSLIKAKYVKNCGQIAFRQFFFYDDNTTLIKIIKDDGCMREVDDLTGVHERHITLYTPRQQAPYGLPEVIEERYWDFDTGQERLLERRICAYSREGYLEREEHYDADGRFTHVETWKYHPHGLVIEHVNALGQLSKKGYDDNDNLIYEEKLGVIKEHCYDYANRLIRTTEHHPDSLSFSISHRYDYIGNRIATTDRYGNETRFEYDDFNRLIKTILPVISDYDGRIFTPIVETRYDEADRPVIKTDPYGHQTCTSYNARGETLQIIYPDATVDRYYYSLDGSLAESISPNGARTTYQRDFLGRVLKQTVSDERENILTEESCTYQGMRLSSKINAEGRKTSYHYDGAGRLIRATKGRQTLSYSYDASSRISQIIHGTTAEEIQINTFVYDFLNRVQEEHQEDSNGQSIEQTFFAYDERGNVIEKRQEGDSGTRLARFRYNTLNQLIETIDSEQHAIHFDYNHFTLNSFGQFVLQITKTDPLGRQTIQIHNTHGHLCEVIEKDPFGTVAAHQTIIFDAFGRPTKTIDAVIINGTIERHLINRTCYHPSGQPEMIIEAAETPLQKITRFTFNDYSQKEQLIKPNGVRIFYFYDMLGRMIRTVSSDRTIDYQYRYNRCHDILSIEDAIESTRTSYDYDTDGLLIQEKLAHGHTLKYTYDNHERTTAITLPDQSGIRYRYASSQLKAVERVKQVEVVYTHTYERYDQTGTLTDSTLPRYAGKLHFKHDRNGRITSLHHHNLSYQVPEQGYDSVGRLTTLDTQDNLGQHRSRYYYNTLDHLIVEQSKQHRIYETDSIHNRLRKNGLKYHVNALNQVEKQGNSLYRYDVNGNIIERNDNGKLTTFAYDALDRLIAVSVDHKTIRYHYDGINRRIAKTKEGNTINYLYQGQNEIGTIDQTGKIIELRLLGSGVAAEIGSTVAIELGEKMYVPIHDLLGHIACLIDGDSGELAESYHYTAFGEETIYDADGNAIKHSRIGNPWRFASKRVDTETGWIYFGKRYYDPELGRWTTPDPASFIDGPNLYSYLKHNPIKSFDAYGLFSEAYKQSCEVGVNAGYYSGQSHFERAELFNESKQRHASHLPEVSFRQGFEKTARAGHMFFGLLLGMFNTEDYHPSGVHHLGRPELPDDKRIFFVNGINTTLKESIKHATYLSDLAGGCNVYIVYNATHGIAMDIKECRMGLKHIATEPVKEIHRALDQFFAAASSDTNLLVICHSQGGIQLSNALLSYSEKLRERVLAVGVASAKYIYRETCRDVTHYRAQWYRDPIGYYDSDGSDREGKSIVTLDSHPNAPWFDHDFQSPTYHDVIKEQLDFYINKKSW